MLVVEDNPDARETLAFVLNSKGYKTVEAANGREALAYLQQSPPPCLIITDLMMPEMDGWAFRAKQRAEPSGPAFP